MALQAKYCHISVHIANFSWTVQSHTHAHHRTSSYTHAPSRSHTITLTHHHTHTPSHTHTHITLCSHTHTHTHTHTHADMKWTLPGGLSPTLGHLPDSTRSTTPEILYHTQRHAMTEDQVTISMKKRTTQEHLSLHLEQKDPTALTEKWTDLIVEPVNLLLLLQ